MIRAVTFLLVLCVLGALKVHHFGRPAALQCNNVTEAVEYDKGNTFTSAVIKDWKDADVQAVKDGTESASKFLEFSNFPSEALEKQDRRELKDYARLQYNPRELDFRGDEASDEELADFGLSPERVQEVFGAETKLHKFAVQQGKELVLLAYDIANPNQEENIPHQAISLGEDTPGTQTTLSNYVYAHRKGYRYLKRPNSMNYVRILQYTYEQFAKRLLYEIDEYQKSTGQEYPKQKYPVFGRLIFLKLEAGAEYLATEIGEGDDKRIKVWIKDAPTLKPCPQVIHI